MSRWKASSLYLLVCAVVASCVLSFMLLVWFPWPLFQITAGGQLALILIAVDMVLGPLLVLVVYREGKKSLKLDLAVIATLQISALAYGIYNINLARPAYLVFANDHFGVVTVKDLEPGDLVRVTRPEFKHIPWGRPRYVAAEPPSERRAKNEVEVGHAFGKELEMFPHFYVPYTARAGEALKRARSIELLQKRAPEVLASFLRKSGKSADSVRFLPLRGPIGSASVLVDAVTAEPLKIVLVDP